MIDICTCIISYIVFSNLVPDMYQDTDTWDSCDMHMYQDTDTWDSCDMHYLDYMIFLDILCYFILWSRVLVIILHDSYLSRTSHVHYIHVTPCMHDLIVHDLSLDYSCDCYYIQFLIFPYILFLCPTYCYYIFIFSLLSFFFLRVLLDLYIIFQYLDQEAGIESCS